MNNSGLKIGNYCDLDGTEKKISALELADKNIVLLSGLDEATQFLPCIENHDEAPADKCWLGDKSKEIHLLNHYLVREDIVKFKGHVYCAHTLSTKRSGGAVYRDEYFTIDNLVHIICGSLRCLYPVKAYEVLLTGVADGLDSPNRNADEKLIEFSIDDDIKSELRQLLEKDGFIKDARGKFGNKLKHCHMVGENIQFIKNHHMAAGKDTNEVESKYFGLLDYCLDLLSKDNYKDFIKWRIKVAENSINSFKLLCHQNYFFDHYIVEEIKTN